MSQNYLGFVPILLTCLIATKVTDTSIPENLKSIPQEILHQLQKLQLNNENIASKLDFLQSEMIAYKQRLEHEFAKQKQELLQDIRKLYEEHHHICVNSTPPNDSGTTKTYTSCADAMGAGGKSGVYQLHIPESNLAPFHAYCLEDPQNGPAWTIFQRRQDGSENFYRNWNDYKTGFGNWAGEFFIGLDRLHALTHAHLHELWIKMDDFENATRYAKYEQFAIGDESQKYILNVLGKFHGDAGDALSHHVGQKFTTKDNDNDQFEQGNCAIHYKGAWWYRRCYHCNLNGLYLRENKNKLLGGVTWETWHDAYYSLKYVHMAIRPVSKI